MLKPFANLSPQLITFVLALRLSQSRPQQRHVIQVADALITTEGGRTVSGLYRHIVGDPCPKAAADTFREGRFEAARVAANTSLHFDFLSQKRRNCSF